MEINALPEPENMIEGMIPGMIPGMADGGGRDYYDPIHVRELAQAYVPRQRALGVLDPRDALRAGTVFPELDMPYDPSYRYYHRHYHNYGQYGRGMWL